MNLVGDCQGGWLATIYAAVHPDTVHTLSVAGAPIDFHAGEPLIHDWVQVVSPIGQMDFYRAAIKANGLGARVAMVELAIDAAEEMISLQEGCRWIRDQLQVMRARLSLGAFIQDEVKHARSPTFAHLSIKASQVRIGRSQALERARQKVRDDVSGADLAGSGFQAKAAGVRRDGTNPVRQEHRTPELLDRSHEPKGQ